MISTKTGDRRDTILNGVPVNKGATVFDALGDLDELNSWLGVCKEEVLPGDSDYLEDMQYHIKQIMDWFTTGKIDGIALDDTIKHMEEYIQDCVADDFVVPSNKIHIARTVCRRAERSFVRAVIEPNIIHKFMNRLSDFLFVMATKY